METKVCFKCFLRKTIDQYYKHSQMKDGYLNKCIDCTKKDVKERYEVLVEDENWQDKERARGREKYHRLYPYSQQEINQESKREGRRNWRERYPEKEKAIRTLGIRLRMSGFHRHHWSYNEDHFLDVIQLRYQDHYKAHRFITYDQSVKMYRKKKTGELLDTREKHLEYITFCITNYPD